LSNYRDFGGMDIWADDGGYHLCSTEKEVLEVNALNYEDIDSSCEPPEVDFLLKESLYDRTKLLVEEQVASKHLKYKKKPADLEPSDLVLDDEFLKIYRETEKEWLNCWSKNNKTHLPRELIGDFVTRLRRNCVLYPNKKKIEFLFSVDHWYDAYSLKKGIKYNSQGDFIKMLDKMQNILNSRFNEEPDIEGEFKEVRESLDKMRMGVCLLTQVNVKLVPLSHEIEEDKEKLCQL